MPWREATLTRRAWLVELSQDCLNDEIGGFARWLTVLFLHCIREMAHHIGKQDAPSASLVVTALLPPAVPRRRVRRRR